MKKADSQERMKKADSQERMKKADSQERMKKGRFNNGGNYYVLLF
jgi:hypothetical protein